MENLKTTWAKETPPYGSFDDYVILESLKTKIQLLIRPEEFDFIMDQLFENFKAGKSKYVQVLKEWNECIVYEGIHETPSLIHDVDDFLSAIEMVVCEDKKQYGILNRSDKELIINFLNQYKEEGVMIFKE